MVASVQPYNLEPGFEAALAASLCCVPRLFSRVGAEVEVAALEDPRHRLLVEAAQACARDTGRGPDNFSLVLQRLCTWRDEGRVNQEQILACMEVLDEVEDAGIPDDNHVLAGIVPVLRRRAEHTAVVDLIDAHGKRKEIGELVRRLDRASRIGETDGTGAGVRVGVGSFQTIARMKELVKLELGVPEIDTLLGGGLWRRALGVVVANSGGGKSTYLSHQAGSAALKGVVTAYATLELPTPMVLARIKANLVNVPVNTILNGSAEALQKMEDLEPSLGPIYVKSFTPYATTVNDLREWVKEIEDELGVGVDLLCTDYADKLGSGKGFDKESGYDTGRIVYEGLRIWAEERNMWSWTASQATRGGKDVKKKLDLQHMADSMHKGRVADIVLTLMEQGEDSGQILFHIAKHRLAKAHWSVGPLPHEFEYGRIAPVVGGLDELGDDFDEW